MRFKKAIGKGETVVVLILSIVIFILLFTATFNWLYAAEKLVDIEVCRDSIITNSQLSGKTLGIFQPALQCPADFIEIKSDNKNPEAAKREIAEKIVKEMYNCWYKTGDGELGLFRRWHWSKEKFCLVCSKFTIDRDFSVDYLYDYIEERKSPTGDFYINYFDTWYGDYDDLAETYYLKNYFFLQEDLDKSGIFYGELGDTRYSKEQYAVRPKFDIKPEAIEKLQLIDELKANTEYTVMYMQRWEASLTGFYGDMDYQTFIVTSAAKEVYQNCIIYYHEKKK